MRRALGLAALAATLAAPALAHGDRPWGDGHHHAWVTERPSAVLQRAESGGAFRVVVHPNLLPYDRALALAVARGTQHCADQGLGAPGPAWSVNRYSRVLLDAWSFEGSCD